MFDKDNLFVSTDKGPVKHVVPTTGKKIAFQINVDIEGDVEFTVYHAPKIGTVCENRFMIKSKTDDDD